MEQVAAYLRDKAVAERSNPALSDLFGRSAFNRYYYAMYLLVRQLLHDLDPSWANISHKAIPDLLTGVPLKRVKKIGKRAGTRGDNEAVQICDRGARALNSLSALMSSAYAARIAADYNPGIKIEFKEYNGFTLYNVSIHDAYSWVQNATVYSNLIKRAWKLTDV